MTMELTASEMVMAALVGVHRHVAAIKRGLPDKYGMDGLGWNAHVEGACGELAVAKCMGRFWSGTVNSFKEADITGGLQVRTRSKPEYELIVRENDNPEHVYVLVTGIAPRLNVVGWIQGGDARRPDWWKEYGGRAGAWFVPQAELQPMHRLQEKIPEERAH